ncbi:MAG: hypothetical protein LBJ60_02115 [Tannerellaceae bacterium]|jgi:hypothetical protein|nr:hypothetical protein [Tannerellaceae bacterium]
MGDLKSKEIEIPQDSDLKDTLEECKKAWGNEYPFLNKVVFEELAENYTGEYFQDELDAFGQELTTFGYALYDISNSEDDITLVLVAEPGCKSFEKTWKKQGGLCKAYKQQGRKFGENARRFNPADKTPCSNAYIYPSDVSICSVAGDYAFGYMKTRKKRMGIAVDLKVNPPDTFKTKRVVYSCAYSQKTGLYAAFCDISDADSSIALALLILGKSSEMEDSPDDKIIAIGKNPKEMERWQIVKAPTGSAFPPATAKLYWFDVKLYFGYGEKVFMIQADRSGIYRCTALMNGKSTFGNVHFIQTGDKTIYLNNVSFLATIKNGTLKNHPFGALHSNDMLRGISSGKNSLMYCRTIARNGKLTPDLIDVNMVTGAYRRRLLKNMDHWAYPSYFNAEWVAICTSSGGVSSKSYDLMQFWNPATDRFLRLKIGAFGKNNLVQIQILSTGEIIIVVANRSEYQIRRPTGFWDFLEKSNVPPLKNEDWQPGSVPFTELR